MSAPITYPSTRKSDHVDNYHGVLIPDPYRWLEETDSPETRDWIERQNKVTFNYLATFTSRDSYRRRLRELWDFPKVSIPTRKGGRYFQLQNTGLQNQDVLFVRDPGSDAFRVLLDPNTLSEEGTVALHTWSVSKNGKWLAYAISASGSDWLTWKIRNVDTGEDLPDEICWSKFSSATWTADSAGFYYARYDEPDAGEDYTGTNYYHKVYYHCIGTSQDQDSLIYERPDQKEWGFDTEVSEDGRYLVLYAWMGTDARNRLFYQDLETDETVVELISDLEAAYAFVGNDDTKFYFRTDLEAPRGRLIMIDVSSPERSNWVTLVPETEDVLGHVKMVNNEFIAAYMQDAHHVIKRHSLDGADLGEIELPGLGSISDSHDSYSLSGSRSDTDLYYGFWSFLFPFSIYRYDFQSQQTEVVFSPDLDFDTDAYITRQVFVDSKDGARVPMYLTHRRDLAPDGSNPVLLYGYGGFNISLLPTFAATRLAWLERGGVYASANLRGGGEYGEEWHKAGMIHHKQNVFDDFIACAEWLIKENITSSSKLAIMGGSNGGVLVGACMNQRPDLFAACVPIVGVMDMLRFQHFTIGWAWVSDYGSSEKENEFQTLLAYSPLHNLKAGTSYPATLVVTGDHDDRVVPGHSFKYAAALQEAQAGAAPVMIRIQTRTGHGHGKPTDIIIQEYSDIFAFIEYALGR